MKTSSRPTAIVTMIFYVSKVVCALFVTTLLLLGAGLTLTMTIDAWWSGVFCVIAAIVASGNMLVLSGFGGQRTTWMERHE